MHGGLKCSDGIGNKGGKMGYGMAISPNQPNSRLLDVDEMLKVNIDVKHYTYQLIPKLHSQWSGKTTRMGLECYE